MRALPEDIVVELLQLSDTMSDAEERAKLLLAQGLVDGLLHVDRHGRGTLVEDGELGTLVEEATRQW